MYFVGGSMAVTLIACLVAWNVFLKPANSTFTHPELGPPGANTSQTARADSNGGQNPVGQAKAAPNGVARLPGANRAGKRGGTKEENPQIVSALSSQPAVKRELPPSDSTKPGTSKPPATSSGDAGALPLEELIAKIGDGVVLITVLDRTGHPVGLGTGFVIDDTGLVATCFHVVRNAAGAQVQFRGGFATAVKGSRQLNSQSDLAILELEKKPPHLVPLALGVSDELRLGQEVIAMGHPSGLTLTPTRGIVSGLHKTSELPPDARQFLSLRKASKDEEWVQTDAVISPGNSGGPLMNRRGEVIGINSWVSTETRFAFAVHVKHLDELRQNLFAAAKPLSKAAASSPAALGLADEPPSELDDKVSALFEEYQRAAEDFMAQLKTLPAGEYSRSEIDALFRKNPANKFAGRFLALGKANRKTKTAVQSYFMACWLMRGADPKLTTGVLQQAGDLMLQDHLDDHELYKVVLVVPSLPQSGGKAFLRTLIQKTQVRETRAFACLALAKTLQHEADEKPESAGPGTDQEIVALLKRVTDEFSDVKLEGHVLSEMVKPLLFAKERLAVGKKAIDIEGPDGEGNEFKLSDYRGKIVLLTFWGDWSSHCVRLYPYQRILVSKYKGRKFAMLGVNTDPPERLDAVQKEKKVNWRSWSDGSRTGPITKQWGVDSYPMMYLIDHKGTIRMRGSFDPDTIDQSIDLLVAEAEGRSRGSRKGSAAVRRILQSH